MDKIILSFEQPFWPKNALRLKFACSEKGKFSHFINLSSNESHILCCFFTDDFNRKLHSQYSYKEIAELAVSFLQGIFPK